ncbi:hypothetical protein DL770_003262 [Monosporascus sp. CRB-9-2]|nr:hypothetical protein DL770_003262 [Monosporascus sp. CRB-9-2]
MLCNIRAFGLICVEVFLLSARVSAQSFPWARTIPRAGWTVTADSYQAGNEPANVLDGNSSTIWHTQYTPSVAPLPHYIQVDMQRSYVVNGFSYQPRQGGSNGNIGQHTITLSNDGNTWSQVVFGTFLNDGTTKRSFFSNATARYIRITAQSEAQSAANQWSSMAELNVYSPDPSQDAAGFRPPPTSQGRWATTIALPIVPAAVALSRTGEVVLWSAFRPDLFSGGTGITQTVHWDPTTQTVSQRSVANTRHDMFCPGISLDVDGRFIVSGGNDDRRTSRYDPASGSWVTASQMNVGRGYQSSTTLADGRVFTIGGSWSGGRFQKDGEVYDPRADTWTNVTGCRTAPMLTRDAQGIYRADNHAWLFAYRENSVFHAGPSRNNVAVNWYGVSGSGTTRPAGTRGDAADAMCGIAVMYDAVQGLILAAGGSPNYQDSSATRDAYRIQLGAVNANPTVTRLPAMAHARAFGNGVVLPDGTVLVVGGQAYAVPFTDTTPALPAELFDPATGRWTSLAPIAVPRTYHSVALLLPDATVLAGGGGLCGTGCPQNHFDVQVFQPPYLFAADGTRARQPVIRSVTPAAAALRPGAALTAETDGAVASFSLVRFGSSTHTVNTDQRRVPLAATAASGTTTYTMTLPSDPGVLLPGYWMLFAINGAGVPSVARTIQVLLP